MLTKFFESLSLIETLGVVCLILIIIVILFLVIASFLENRQKGQRKAPDPDDPLRDLDPWRKFKISAGADLKYDEFGRPRKK